MKVRAVLICESESRGGDSRYSDMYARRTGLLVTHTYSKYTCKLYGFLFGKYMRVIQRRRVDATLKKVFGCSTSLSRRSLRFSLSMSALDIFLLPLNLEAS